ncbi:hypothetical protein ASC61_18530 [Aeromicrobium sp. Root344]|uniref:hypothetical protein n=1 Tax=Aeromicrobium sp. Root344 TaxID=1736521 RepID=UPI0006F2D774|nr:hypothetical protein [Aeromicrobium sp. Root344]KQV76835.1 hypothetical protein ASC61_18530 [Aeromicrobium sp. Root344]
MTIEMTPTVERTTWRRVPEWALVPIAALVWWLAGFLPWLLNGAGRDVLSEGGVGFLLLPPLMSGGVSQLVLGAGVGGVAAGLTSLLSDGSRALRAGACAAGVAVALLVTLLQTRNGVSDTAFDSRVTNGLTVVVVVTTIVGLGLGLLSLVGRGGLGFAVGALAGATPYWVMTVFMAFQFVDTTGRLEVAHRVSEWSGAVVLAGALLCVGLVPGVRAVAWVGIVLLAWFIGPTITAAGYMEVFLRPGMGVADRWGDQLSATADVWRTAASLDARSLAPWAAPIVVAAAAATWLALRARARTDQPAQ